MSNTKKYFLLLGVVTLFFIGCGETSNPDKQLALEEPIVEELDSAKYLKEGGEIAQATFKVLSENLQKAMAEGGVENALKFCNVNAMPLTDSLSKHYNVEIKRTSHKVRNPKNAPTVQEQVNIDAYLANKMTKPTLQENPNHSVSFYAPITMKGLCVVCHGQVGTTLAEKDYQIIQSLYPQDKAIGFNVDELRGMWSITFNK
ncbi:MAG: DUF3365 domain-containing protein [Flavobacteriales bacterium]|nr:DUF3365 domain-containing protein [Flavobacteriales bacterium]